MHSPRGHWRASTRRGRGGFQHRAVLHSAPGRFLIPCRFFNGPGSCRHGEQCKFSHEQPEGQRNPVNEPRNRQSETATQEEERLQYYDWKSLMRSAPATFCHDAATFLLLADLWSAGVKVLDGEGREWHQLLVQDLVSDEKSQRAGYGYHYLSLTLRTKPGVDGGITLEVIQNFLRVISHPSLLDCLSIETRVGTMYNMISGANGERAISFFMGVCVGLLDRQLCQEAPERSGRCINAMIDALSELLRRERRVSLHPDLLTLFDRIDEVFGVLEVTGLQEDFDSQSGRTRMARLRRVVTLSSDRLAADSHEEDSGDITTSFDVGGHVFPVALDPPGGRHDNDHLNIQDIKILPTPQEISSEDIDYLPSTDCRQPHFYPDPVRRYLDTHFRLLRHEIFGPLKEILGGLIFSLEQNVALPQRQTNDINAHIYRDASIGHIAVDNRRGFEAHVSFNSPTQLRQKSATDQRRWWENSKRLEQGGLVCLVCLDGKSAVPLFLVVTEKSTDNSRERGPSLVPGMHKPTIGTKLATSSRADLCLLMRAYQGRLRGVLVDLPGLIPATFVPILKNLQELMQEGELPFQEWIVPDRSRKHLHQSMLPPKYARRDGFSFSLRSITPDISYTDRDNLYVSPNDAADDDNFIRAIEARTGLDHGQCQALVTALTREFALIQGPPGTGKSYVGVKLLQVLLDCKKDANLGPIIIICYTNHALDQFLKHLLDVGITNMIRIGGQSRLSELDRFNLRSVRTNLPKTGYERSLIAGTHGELEDQMERMGNMLASLHKIRGGSLLEPITRFLEREYPGIACQLTMSDEDGSIRVARDSLVAWAEGSWRINGDATQTDEADDVDSLIAKASRDVHSLNTCERRALIDHWIQRACKNETNRLFEAICESESLREILDSVHEEVNRRALLAADVIGITTTGLARDIATIRKLRSKVVICEEAAEVLEAHMISALMPGVEHLIQIGDHQQLRPQINNYSLSGETPRGMLYQVDRSQFERLAVGQPGIPSMPVTQLSVQRRMRPQIANLVRDTMYATLEDHPSVKELPDVVGMLKNVFWLDHPHMEDTSSDDGRLRSHSNAWEVDMTKSLVRHLVRQGAYKSTDIAVLTPYTGQLQKLRTALSNDFEVSLSDRDTETLAKEGFEIEEPARLRRAQLIQSLHLATVDNFQGEEAKIVVVSLVRSNKEHKVGFLRTPNRINVLLSRAQHGLYLIGNGDTYANVPMWAAVRQQLEATGSVGKAFALRCPRHHEKSMECAEPEEFLRYSPEGGCDGPCEWRLVGCGHRCPSKCHSEPMHSTFACPEPCPRVRLRCDHMCPKLCGEPCGACQTPVDNVQLQCGHIRDGVPCHQIQEKDKITCSVLVDKKVVHCGHILNIWCWQDVSSDSFACTVPCAGILKCGHACTGTCGKCSSQHQPCSRRCGRPRSTCGHSCDKPCHVDQECPPCEIRCEVRCPHSRCSLKCEQPCAPCIEPCAWACEHQGSCSAPCAAPCNRLPCDERCKRELSCGHQCPSLCGEICPEGYCQQCSARAGDRVDLFELRAYRDINLDATPIIVINCGHFFTAESLDGLVSMGSVYRADGAGNFTQLLDPSEVLAVPRCPDCKQPIQQFATRRFNRVINLTVMDELTRKFLIKGQADLEALQNQVRIAEILSQGARSDLKHSWRPLHSLMHVGLLGNGRPGTSAATGIELKWKKLERQVNKFCDEVEGEQQPSKKLFDAIIKAKERKPDDPRLVLATQKPVPAPDMRIILGGRQLQLRIQTAMLRNQLESLETKSRPGITTVLKTYQDFIQESLTSHLPRFAVQASIGYALIARVIISSHANADKSFSGHIDTVRGLLDQAADLCKQPFADRESLRAEVEEARRMLRESWYEPITAEELNKIKTAMVSGPQGSAMHSGHWYKCQNGHVFAVGGCGMPTEIGRCPECGSRIGGENHQLLNGVSRAEEMEGR